MPVETFKVAFTYYYVGMYQNWHTSTFTPDRAAKSSKTSITSDVDQDVILTLRWIAYRRYPLAGCSGQNDNETQSYNLFLTNRRTGERLQEPSFNDLGYIYYRFEGGIKANDTWDIMVYDFNFGRANNQDFTLTLFANDQEINFM